MSGLLVDPAQIKTFAEAIFPYIGASGVEQWISLRVLPDDGNNDRCLSISPVQVNSCLEPIVDAAITLAQYAADHRRRPVFARRRSHPSPTRPASVKPISAKRRC